jgi:transposase-like protein
MKDQRLIIIQERIKNKAKEFLKEEIFKQEFKLLCPKCNSKNIAECKGGTCYNSISKIKFICSDCLYEW